MGILDDIIAQDAAFAFLEPDLMPGTEAVVYTPRNGTPRTVNAGVERFALEDREGVPRPRARVTLRNHATAGVLATAVNVGGDTITAAIEKGGTARAYLVSLPQDGEWHDAGVVTLEVG